MKIVEISHGSAEYQRAKDLRDEVLRKPLGLRLSDKDTEGEESQWHLVALAGDEVVATLSIKPLEAGVIKFRQMVVATGTQGSGLGMRMMEFGEALAKERGFTAAELHARVYAQGFYEKLGYVAVGDIFKEVALPHIKMIKAIT